MPASRGPLKHRHQFRQFLRRIQIGLVEHENDRLVAGRQFHQGRVFHIVQVRIDDEQHQVGPRRRLVRHRRSLRAVDFVEPRRIDQV